MTYRLEEIASITGSTLTGRDCRIERVITDSRNPYDPAATLFVAIRGNNHDGHAFIRSLYAGGVRAFLTDTDIDTAAYPEAGFVRCPDSVAALQRLATYHRNRFRGTVVAITGSNGKTVTKEWIAQLCPPGVKLFRSPRSYNSQIGVALSLLMLDGDERLAIIEAGISEPGEMERLERMIRPDVGIFTNLGDAHQEHFSDLGQKLNEKLILFRQAQTIIYNASDPTVAQRICELYGDRQLAGVTPQSYDLSTLPFSDGASRENAAEAIALYDVLGFDRQPVLVSLPTLQSVAMRMELKEGISGCKLVNDSYNSDINSLALSLDYLVSVAGGQPKILILSDIRQSGLPAEKLYEQVAALLRTKRIDTLIGIGEEIVQHAASFGCDKAFYRNTDEFLRSYNRTQFVNKSILLKGSRAFGFEKISHALEQRTHTTVLEVNLDNMIHNLNYFRSLLDPGVRIMIMDKASGYGTGTYEVASMLQHQGVSFLAVAFADEGVTLREAGITMPVVVLNADSDSFEIMIDYGLEPEIYSFSSLEAFSQAVRRHGETRYPIHLKLDTGMHRLGFTESDIDGVVAALRNQRTLYIRSVFTHLAGSDEERHNDFTREQIARYTAMSDRLLEAFPGEHIIRHVCNTAGIERFPEAQFDMVRLGVGLYGISFAHQEQLLPVSTLRSRIVQIKDLQPGETVGYGRWGIIDRPTRTATVPIGYADGLDRHLSRGAWSMLVNGRPAPIIGNICMDTCMLDITGIDAREGDPVTIFGAEPGNTVSDMAAVLKTIPYEIMTSISTRVKRVYTKE